MKVFTCEELMKKSIEEVTLLQDESWEYTKKLMAVRDVKKFMRDNNLEKRH